MDSHLRLRQMQLLRTISLKPCHVVLPFTAIPNMASIHIKHCLWYSSHKEPLLLIQPKSHQGAKGTSPVRTIKKKLTLSPHPIPNTRWPGSFLTNNHHIHSSSSHSQGSHRKEEEIFPILYNGTTGCACKHALLWGGSWFFLPKDILVCTIFWFGKHVDLLFADPPVCYILNDYNIFPNQASFTESSL